MLKTDPTGIEDEEGWKIRGVGNGRSEQWEGWEIGVITSLGGV